MAKGWGNKGMDKDTPSGWAQALIGDVLRVKGGYAFSSKDYSKDGIPLIRISEIQDGKISLSNAVKIPLSTAKLEFKVETGDLLIAMSGATTGKIGIYRGKEICLQNQRVGKFEVYSPQLINKKFMHFYLLWLQKYIEIAAYGGAQPNISASVIENFSISLPPLNEQHRIVAKLEQLLSKVQSCQERLDRIPKILKRFRQSVLAAACSGRLTEDWREQNPDVEWENTILQNVIYEKLRNGYSPKPVKYTTNLKVITLTATTSGKFSDCFFKYINDEIDQNSYLWIKNGDILIQRGNSLEHVGISAIYEGCSDQFIYPDLMIKVVADKMKILNKFLYYILSSFKIRQYFRENATGTAGNMPKINQSVLLNTPIPLPPLAEQQEIVRRVESLFHLADQVEQKYNKAKAYVDQLTQSILAKAFRGELVPQDPNDEPAEVLLERIRKEKASQDKAAGKKRSRKLEG